MIRGRVFLSKTTLETRFEFPVLHHFYLTGGLVGDPDWVYATWEPIIELDSERTLHERWIERVLKPDPPIV